MTTPQKPPKQPAQPARGKAKAPAKAARPSPPQKGAPAPAQPALTQSVKLLTGRPLTAREVEPADLPAGAKLVTAATALRVNGVELAAGEVYAIIE